MKFKKVSYLIVLILSLAMLLLSCSGDEGLARFSLLNGSVSSDGVTHTLSVGSSVESIDLAEYVQVDEDAEWSLFSSADMETELEKTVVTLQTGENILYVRVEDSLATTDYTVKIIRKKTVTVTFDTNGGTECKPLVIDEGSTITFPQTLKAGYELSGWDYDASVPVTADITVKASWTAKKFNVILKAEGTSLDNQAIEVVFDSEYSVPAPTKNGYKFVKWSYNDADFASSGVWKNESDVELVAQFAKETYKISYVYNADVAGKTVNYTIEDEVILETPTHPDGLEFLGWYSDSQLTQKVQKIEKGSTGDKTLYASWKTAEKTYNITIDADGLEIDGETIGVKYGEAYTLPTVQREGYDFVAWMNGTSVVQTSGTWNIHSDVTLTISWNPILYKLEYVYNTSVANKVTSYTVEDEVILEAPTHPDGLEFLGWYSDSRLTQKVEKIEKGSTGAKVLYASWKEELEPGDVTYEITVDADGFDCDGQKIPVKYGESYTLPEIAPLIGYEFTWLLDGGKIASSGTWKLLENKTVVLEKTAVSYDIKYVFNADIASKTDTYTIEQEFVLLAPVHPEGLEFLGWYSDAQLTQKVEKIEKGSYGEKTFYASWKEKEVVYTVTIDAEGFDCDGQTLFLKYGESYTLPAIGEKKGYIFVAWKHGDTVVPTSGQWAITSDATLTIEWDLQKYTVTYETDDKTENPNTTKEFTVESDTITLIDPTRPDATFIGWYTDSAYTQKITEITKGTAENIVLYAKFEITFYKLIYDANGGSVSQDSVNCEMGENITLLTPQKPGYKFGGWYYDGTKLENGEWTFNHDVTVVAKWTAIDYLITYELNGGATTETLKVYYTVEDTLTLPKPTRADFYFHGWSEGESENTYQNMVISQGTTGNKKFVANWTYFSYSYAEDNTATVTGYLFSTSRDTAKIPEIINYNGVNYTVTGIGASVFSGMGNRIYPTVIGDEGVSSFTVVVPHTLKTIGTNAFLECSDVVVRALVDISVDLNEWADALTIVDEESGNKHVRDVIKGLRPAIGWSIYG